MFISKLDVVNDALSCLGEAGLTDLQEDHAYRDMILGFLTTELDRICAKGWWFNQEYVRLVPDANSRFIYVPTDVYSVVPIQSAGFSVTQMGRRMYDARRRTYEWSNPLPVRLTRKFDFEDLPYNAAAAIRDATTVKFQGRIDADRETKADAEKAAAYSMEELHRINLQQQKFNMLNRPGMTQNGWLASHQGQHYGEVNVPGPNIIML
ncbi:hypothetical protein [Stenotrophomonas phage TS-10]|uniref:Tail tubular protein A n=1 Tax=Stenotrophomonas phage TS-10 TaxID=2886106 RepID=A0AAE8Y9M1_9CAUD|nr:hypothetical protein [Stenotrophomonas phage TS-10]